VIDDTTTSGAQWAGWMLAYVAELGGATQVDVKCAYMEVPLLTVRERTDTLLHAQEILRRFYGLEN
jgi:hypothetical protein